VSKGRVYIALPEQQAKDLADHFGGQRAAARALGIPQSTLWGWLHPERKRERDRERKRERYATDAEYRERVLRQKREWKAKRMEQGLCSNCGQPRLSEWLCWDCLNKKQFQAIEAKAREAGVDVSPIWP
jgi:hypothetical protein